MSVARVGIVGCGNITSTIHLPILRSMSTVKLEFLADLRAPNQLASEYGTRAIGTDQVSALPDCDIAFIATPVGVRAQYVQEFGQRGSFIFTEKPFALNVAQHRQFLDWSENASCDYMRTTFSAIRQIETILNAGLFGRLERITVTEGGIVGATGMATNSYQTNVAMSGGGILMETGCHTFSQLTYLLRECEWEVISASVDWIDKLDVEARANLRAHSDGVVEISCHLSTIAPVPNKMVCEFESAFVTLDHTDSSSRLEVLGRNMVRCQPFEQDMRWPTSPIQAFFWKWHEVVEMWSSSRECDTSAETSVDTTKLIEAIYAAGARGDQ